MHECYQEGIRFYSLDVTYEVYGVKETYSVCGAAVLVITLRKMKASPISFLSPILILSTFKTTFVFRQFETLRWLAETRMHLEVYLVLFLNEHTLVKSNKSLPQKGPSYSITGAFFHHQLFFLYCLDFFNPFTPKSAKFQTEERIMNFILQNGQKQTVPLESTAP